MLKASVAALSTALVTFLVAIVTIPTDYVAGRLKFAINRADQREDRYSKLSEEASRFIFAAQIFREFLARDLDRETVTSTISEYNTAIVNLRAHEYANRAMIRKYWSEETARGFDAFMKDARSVDAIAHRVNDPMIAYIADPAKPPVLRDPRVKAIAGQLSPAVTELCKSGENFLFALSGVTAHSDRKSCD
jgi:hypothetical protein